MYDTGSTITVISKGFLEKNKYKIPYSQQYRSVTTANGDKTNRPIYKNARIQVDEDLELEGSYIIGDSEEYDVLVGLDIIDAIRLSKKDNTFYYRHPQTGEQRTKSVEKVNTRAYTHSIVCCNSDSELDPNNS